MTGDDKVTSARELKAALVTEKVITIQGLKFKIKKLGPVDLLGTELMPDLVKLVEENKKDTAEETAKAIVLNNGQRSYEAIYDIWRSLIPIGVVEPKIIKKEAALCADDEISIETILSDFKLASDLAEAIKTFALGGVQAPFPVEQEKGAPGLPDGERVQETAQ